MNGKYLLKYQHGLISISNTTYQHKFVQNL